MPSPDAPFAPELLAPPHLHTRAEVLTRPSPVPALRGIYAWYFDVAPGKAPFATAHEWEGSRLLYVGIAPRQPTANAIPSRRTLRHRIREHYRLNAYGSTLRLTLGCLLGLELRRIASRRRPGTARRMTFGHDGEAQLNAWMEDHARVVWLACADARHLYVSPLWRKRRAYAEASGGPWYILSAKHGLLDPDEVVAPYDLALTRLSAAERRVWGASVVAELGRRLGDLRGTVFEVHAGRPYRDAITPGVAAAGGLVEAPLAGLSLGAQLASYSSSSRRSDTSM